MTASDFPAEFQRSIVRLMLHDAEFLYGYRQVLHESAFTVEDLRWIVRGILKVFDVAHTHPQAGSVLAEVTREVPPGLSKPGLEDAIRLMYRAGKPPDADYVRDRVARFGRHQNIEAVVLNWPTYETREDYDGFMRDVVAANTITSDALDGGYDYLERVEERMAGIEHAYMDALPTGMKAIDQRLPTGGLNKGQLGIFLGLPGYHKTDMLVNVGIGALAQGKKVFHAFFEGNCEELAWRYDSWISGMPLAERLLNKDVAIQRIQEWRWAHPSQLMLKFWPRQTCTMAAFEAHLSWLASRGFAPDLLIADYVSEMKPSRRFDDFRHGVAELYAGYQSLGARMKVPAWSAIQSNRQGNAFDIMEKGGVLTMANCAEDFEPARDAHLFLTLNQTREEKVRGAIRVHCGKSRTGPTGWTEELRVDAALSRVTDWTRPPVTPYIPDPT